MPTIRLARQLVANKSNVPDHAVVFYYERLKDGFLTNSFAFSPLMSACAKTGCLGQKCHGQVVKNDADGVLELFDAMPCRNLVRWNVMMTGYLNSNNPGKCLKLFREMAQRGLNGNDTTIVLAVSACARSARMKEGKSVHGRLIKKFKDLNLIIGTTLIYMYSRCGRAEIARLIFDRISIKNIVCWNAMILGYCIHGNRKDGLNLYSNLLSSRLESTGKSHVDNPVLPDEITFVSVLCACAREGLVTEERKYFGNMSDAFGIKPSFAHYWCLANILENVGLMQEAIETLKNMPVDSDLPLESSLWSELLGSARLGQDVSLGEQIANKLIDHDPENFWHYLLLVNMYAAAGR
ncbi:putative F-box protein CPR30-like isoform X1 [Capsicum annuum]|nr:putative F-box protein CPR30-like isoform X1 [Capsicum annuum]